MVRPCFLIVDPEHSGSISTRKLIIESAKLNVITAYSGGEAIETLKKYPAVDGIVCNVEVHDVAIGTLIENFKSINPRVPVISIGPLNEITPKPDYALESFDARRLLDIVQSIKPDKVSAILENENKLREEEMQT